MGKNVILKSYLGEIETEEQDLVLWNDFFTDEEMENDYPQTIYAGDNGNYSGECAPIKIDEMIETLKSMKSDGANYVEIGYHTDHYSYLINALHIRKATPEEIKKNEEEEKEYLKSKIEKKINDFEEEIKKLKHAISQ